MAAWTKHGADPSQLETISAETNGGNEVNLSSNELEENGDMCNCDDEQKGGKSRFKVEFVDESRKKSQVNGWDSPRDGHKHRHVSGRERRDSGRSARERKDSGRECKFSDPESPVLSVRSMSPTNTYVGYDTHNLKTFGHNTHEALPHVDHYRNLLSTSATHALKARPTLDELHEEKEEGEKRFREPLLLSKDRSHSDSSVKASPTGKKPSSGAIKFGWIKGVLVSTFPRVSRPSRNGFKVAF